jgi:ABC-type multidrug transport system fused ATPase/permease subunit
MPIPVMPKDVRQLSWTRTPLSRVRRIAGRNEEALNIIVVCLTLGLVLLAMFIDNWRLAISALLGSALYGCFIGEITDPEPLLERDAEHIEHMLKLHPAWLPVVAAWMAKGPLEKRHLRSLEEASELIRTREAKEKSEQSSIKAQTRLRLMESGRFGARVDQIKAGNDAAAMDMATAPAPKASLSPPRL